MNSNEHFIVGGIVSFIASCVIQKQIHGNINFGKSFCYSLIGGCVALLPDILEPATNPNHRDFCHSGTVGVSSVILINRVKNNSNLPTEQKEFFISMISAYDSHLVLDSQTPKGLPLI